MTLTPDKLADMARNLYHDVTWLDRPAADRDNDLQALRDGMAAHTNDMQHWVYSRLSIYPALSYGTDSCAAIVAWISRRRDTHWLNAGRAEK